MSVHSGEPSTHQLSCLLGKTFVGHLSPLTLLALYDILTTPLVTTRRTPRLANYTTGHRSVDARVRRTGTRNGTRRRTNLRGTLDRIATRYASTSLGGRHRDGILSTGRRIDGHRTSLSGTVGGNSPRGVGGHGSGLTRSHGRLRRTLSRLSGWTLRQARIIRRLTTDRLLRRPIRSIVTGLFVANAAHIFSFLRHETRITHLMKLSLTNGRRFDNNHFRHTNRFLRADLLLPSLVLNTTIVLLTGLKGVLPQLPKRNIRLSNTLNGAQAIRQCTPTRRTTRIFTNLRRLLRSHLTLARQQIQVSATANERHRTNRRCGEGSFGDRNNSESQGSTTDVLT